MPVINKALTLKDLPAPPSDKIGWPWTEENQPLPERMPDGSEWPRISIVTPSYNYGQFIEETIRSVLLQGYPNLEYIIIDGGSTDNTVEIIKKYEKYFAYWVSEKDGGQTDAINKGYQHCTGDLFVWLNADDSYTESSILQKVVNYYLQGYQLIAGGCQDTYTQENEKKTYIYYSAPTTFERYLKFWISNCNYTQPSVFVAKNIVDKCLPLDWQLYILMDYQFFLRVLSQKPKSIYVNQAWTNCKKHGLNKTMLDYPGGMSEFYQVSRSEAKKLSLWQQYLFLNELKDYTVIQSLLENFNSLTPMQVLSSLASRPIIVRWPLFWKILLKYGIGTKAYSWLKKLAN
ncbi:MAG: glycosyltransferase family 2 protein [Phormidium sp.]